MAKGDAKELRLKENEVLINNEVKEILPVTIRYLKNGYFNGYRLIQDFGATGMFPSADGNEIIRNFLIAIFNDKTGEYVDSIIDDLDVETLFNIVKIAKKVSRVREEEEVKNIIPDLEGGV